jgi:hypothetical protein
MIARYIPKVILVLLLLIFCGVVFHAPLSVGFGSLWPDLALPIKAWKEVLVLVVLCLLSIEVSRQKKWRLLWDDWLMRIAGLYALLHYISLLIVWQGGAQVVAGLMIDLRFIAFFVAIYISCRLYPAWRKPLLIGGGVAAVFSMLFALLQVIILPHDVLSLVGYDESTIAPYLTVDQNYNFIRINGTLRGPNPLGIYAGMVVAVGAALLLSRWHQMKTYWKMLPWFVVGTIGMASVALWFSYSRSALIMAACATGMLFAMRYWSRIPRTLWIAIGAAIIVAIGGIYALKDTSFVSTVILHEDPEEGGSINSNDGHRASLIDGVVRMLRQPFGAGVGSTGSPSLMGDDGLIIENHYLYIAHEVGWLGLAIFLVLFVFILCKLWARRDDWLAASVFVCGVGIAIAALFLPVWADDTVSMVWWGLAGVALASDDKWSERVRKNGTFE